MLRPDVSAIAGTGSRLSDDTPPRRGDSTRTAQDWIGHHGPILDGHPLPTAVLDAAGRLQLLNHAARSLFEVPLHAPLPDLIDLLHPDEIDRAMWLRRDFLNGGPESLTSVLRWQTWRHNPLMLRVTLHRTLIAPSETLLILGFEDQTRLHALEIARRHHATGVAISRLGADSAHALLSCLAAIRLRTQECRLDAADLAEHLEAIDDACRRAAAITFPLLAFSRPREVRTRSLDLAAHVGVVVRDLDALVGDRVRLECTLPSSPCIVLGDDTLLEQVIVHLVSSAVEASPPGARITVRLFDSPTNVEAHRTADNAPDSASGATSRHFAVLAVHDAGEPFAESRDANAGPSQNDRAEGMAIVRRVILGMDGTVHVESGSNGTIVTLGIPCVHSDAAPRAVLGLVDSDPRRRATVRHVLVASGYDVMESADISEMRVRIRTSRRPAALLIGHTPGVDRLTEAPLLFSVPVAYFGDVPMASVDELRRAAHPYLFLPASPMEYQCAVGEFAERLLGGHGQHT